MAFFVPGVAKSKGSRKALPRGGKAASRYVVLVEDGTARSRKEKAAWYTAASNYARAAWAPLGVNERITGPVAVSVVFRFPIPMSRRSGRRLLKPGDQHISKPDTDKLMRALGDSLALAGILKDDAQISSWKAEKIYGAPDEEGADVVVSWA